MATIHFVDKNNNIGQVYSFDKQIGPFCIASCDQNGTTHYIPTDGAGYSSYNEDKGSYINKYSYSSSSPSIHAVTAGAGGEIINAFNMVSTIIRSGLIPAGTYSPSTFRSLIQKFIWANGSRIVYSTFSVTVNGGTYNVPLGREIKYCTTNTAGSGTSSSLEIVTFNGDNTVQAMDAQTFRGTYVVYASNFSGDAQFSAYANYSITVSNNISFL